MTKPYAVVAITTHGTIIARRLREEFPLADVYYPVKFAHGDEDQRGLFAFEGSVVQHVPALFQCYQGLIGIVSLGAMVRLIAPLLKNKRTDPAVVVIDDRAEHVISVLSGHLGGANQLTREVARILGAQPVITTASDVGDTVAVDLLGREFGWEIENVKMVTPVSAAVVNDERVHIIQEAGEEDWWPAGKPLPVSLSVFHRVEDALQHPFDAALVITPHLLTDENRERLLSRGVLYRPKVLVLGVGCNRGTSRGEIELVIQGTLAAARLSVLSVRTVATIDVKADEPGLLAVCQQHGWPLVTYSAEQLNRVSIPHPSETVFKYVGSYGVSEPAAKLASGAEDWMVEKVRSGNVTISVCIIPHRKVDRSPRNENAQ
jgi:cobalt-precorrin 5A hydrolase